MYWNSETHMHLLPGIFYWEIKKKKELYIYSGESKREGAPSGGGLWLWL